MTSLLDSGVLGMLARLDVRGRRGEFIAQAGAVASWREDLCLVGSICHRSTGAGGGCFSRMRSYSWASMSRRLDCLEVITVKGTHTHLKQTAELI